jgi:diacylglycerol kinase (ATP)
VVARVAVVVNPSSGRGRARRLLPQVRGELARLDVDAEILISEGPDHPPKLAAEAAASGAEMVVALGGDGMAGMVARGLVGTETALALIPTGTGNDFAVNLGYSRKKPLEAVRVLTDPRFRQIDVGRVRCATKEETFINVAGVGFDSVVNDVANRMRTRIEGTAKYVAAVLKVIPRFEPSRFELSIDGERRVLHSMMVTVGNGVSYGGGMKICPDASLDDGMLDVTVIGAMSMPQFLWNFPKVFRGTHIRHPKVSATRGSRIEVSSDREFEVWADGEHVGPLPATLEIVPQALRLVVPKAAT